MKSDTIIEERYSKHINSVYY